MNLCVFFFFYNEHMFLTSCKLAFFSMKKEVGLSVADWAKNHSSNSRSFLPTKKNSSLVTLLRSKFLKYFFLFSFLLESNSLESFLKSWNYFLDSHLLHKSDVHPQQYFPLVLIICSLAFLWGLLWHFLVRIASSNLQMYLFFCSQFKFKKLYLSI